VSLTEEQSEPKGAGVAEHGRKAVQGDGGRTSALRRRDGRQPITIRPVRLVYPAVLVLSALVLTILGWSGTSVGSLRLVQPHPTADPSLVIGTPRPIRSDEWAVATPLIVAQSHNGFPRVEHDGIGQHDLTVILNVPNTDWSTTFKPWDAAMLALPLDQGFAARWWLMSLVLLIGTYLLLLEITDRTAVAVLFSLGLWLSPFFHWWYEPAAIDTVGLGAMALAGFLYALRAPTEPRRFAWIALAAYSTVGFVLLFYPPFQIPIVLVFGTIGIAEVIGRHSTARLPWRRVVTDFAVVVAASGVTLALFYLHAHNTITAVNDTVYPAHRRVSGGSTSLVQLLSAPFGVTLALHGNQLSGTNQSEVSSFLLLGPFALLQVFHLGLRQFEARWRAVLLGTSAVFVLLATWYLIGLPSVLASVLLLDRVVPGRAIIGVGTAGIFLMAFFCAADLRPGRRTTEADGGGGGTGRDNRPRRQRLFTGAMVCGVLAFGLYFWAGRVLITEDPGIGLGLVAVGAVSLAVAVVVFLTADRHVIAGGVALVIFGAVVSLPSNPLYRGLGELTDSSIAPVFTRVAQSPPDAMHTRWMSYDGIYVNDVLEAMGLPTLSSVSQYPDAATWHILDPTDASKDVWNRYANVYFTQGAPGSNPVISLQQQDVVQVTMDPCGPAAGRLGVGFVVSPTPLTGSCLVLATQVDYLGGPRYIYVRQPTATP
jgi:hypothetical protein